jgi:hypothetical protein
MSFSIKPILTRGTRIGIGFSILVVLFTLPSCEENVTPPVAPAGRRDYEWTVDTLQGSPGELHLFFQHWGSSPTDVWVTNTGLSKYPAWHFDGDEWSPDTSLTRMSWRGIWGFGPDNVWACEGGFTSGSRVWQYDGVAWREKTTLVPMGSDMLINGIWGDRPDRFFLLGAEGKFDGSSYRALLVQSDGRSFQRFPLPDRRVQLLTMRKDVLGTGRLYFYGETVGGATDTAWFFELADRRLRQLREVTSPADLNELGGNVYFTFDKKIYRFDGIEFKMVVDLSGTQHVGRLWGRSIRDVFTVATSGLGHYNGTDYQVLVTTSQFINDVAVFEKEVFVLLDDDDFTRTFIMHGVLKGG